MSEKVFTNGRVVGRREVFKGSLRVEGGRIAAIDRGSCAVPGAIDLEGHYLLPGLIDVHTDNLERHMLPRSSSRWPGPAALVAHDAQVAGVGITTVLDAVCIGLDYDVESRPRDFYNDSLAALKQATGSGWLRADHFLHLRCELPGENVAAQLEVFLDEPLLRLVSLMDHTPGQRQSRDVSRVRRIAERRGSLTDDAWQQRLAEAQRRQDRFAAGNRARLIELMRGHPAPLASHDDSTVNHVEEAHASGIRISEFPTTLAAAEAARRCAMYTVMGAPNVVLGRSQSGNVSAREVAEAGLLDALSSDYAPISMLHAAFLLAGDEEQALPGTVAMISANPAAMVGLKDRGSIEPGLRADLVQVHVGAGIPRARRVWREGERVA